MYISIPRISKTRTKHRAVSLAVLATLFVPAALAGTDDWPMWGRTPSRSMSTDSETRLASWFHPGEFVGASDVIDASKSKNVKWIAKLGSQTYGNPTVSQGRVFVGTNNDAPRDERFKGDRSALYCLDEATGDLIWMLNLAKLSGGKVNDWEYLGICSSPTIEGDRVYLVTNQCEVVCLDINGMTDGNDGPFVDEGAMMAQRGGEPIDVRSTDADVIWRLNMIDECGVFPHNITSSSVLIAGDQLWVSTSNGVDFGHVETPAPNAPSLIVVDKYSGALVAEEASGLSQRILHCNWSSPAFLNTDDLKLGIFGGPDGWCYAFDTKPIEDEDGYPVLREVWRFDCNPPDYRVRDGKRQRYATRGGPSEIMSTPVTYKNRVYTLIGQDPEHGEGMGNLVCIDATKTGDTTESAEIWSYSKIARGISTPGILDGLLYAADYSGFVYCLDAETGEEQWVHDTKGHIWGSPLIADGKVYIGNEDGYLTILKVGRDYELINEIYMQSPIYSSPIAANGVIYIATHTHLFAIQDKGETPTESGDDTP